MQLRSIVVYVRNVNASAAFFERGLGLALVRRANDGAELSCGHTTLGIQQAESEAQCSVGSSPVLAFETTDLTGTVARLLQMGAHLDGPIRFPVHGKVRI
eukprot:TRINITY_DN1991_c0_g1_i4.p3 TRINITY_DN1991_c0_g1~~TRINITY_DN1991_c0_g1_i4.p3  ORF type:complete len:100 (-),score=9.45 TRINITY_DN1991_c0_g1_i4:200-499(-)